MLTVRRCRTGVIRPELHPQTPRGHQTCVIPQSRRRGFRDAEACRMALTQPGGPPHSHTARGGTLTLPHSPWGDPALLLGQGAPTFPPGRGGPPHSHIAHGGPHTPTGTGGPPTLPHSPWGGPRTPTQLRGPPHTPGPLRPQRRSLPSSRVGRWPWGKGAPSCPRPSEDPPVGRRRPRSETAPEMVRAEPRDEVRPAEVRPTASLHGKRPKPAELTSRTLPPPLPGGHAGPGAPVPGTSFPSKM